MLKKSLMAFGLRIAGAFIWLFYSFWLARTFEADDYGTTLYVVNTAAILASLACAGYTPTLLRYGAPAWAHRATETLNRLVWRALRICWMAVAAMGVVVAGAWVAGVDNIAFSHPALPALALIITLATTAIQLQAAGFRAAGSIATAVLGNAVYRVGVPLALTMVAGLFLPRDAMVAVAAFAIGSIVVSLGLGLGLSRRLRRGPQTPQAPQAPQAQSQSEALPERVTDRPPQTVVRWLWIGGLGRILVQNIDALLVGSLLGAVEAGLYLTAKRVAALVQTLADAVRVVAGPRLATLYAEDGTGPRFRAAAAEANLLFMVLVGASAVGIAALGWLILAVFGPDFPQAYPILLVMTAAAASYAVFGPVAILMNMTKLERASALIAFSGAVITAVCVVLFTQLPGAWGGGMGAALALLLGSYVMTATSSLVIWRKLGIPPAVLDGQAWMILRQTPPRAMLKRLLKRGKGSE